MFTSAKDIDQAWSEYFPEGPDWREVSDEVSLPGFLEKMDANPARDQHLFNSLIELVNNGERVFVIAGSSHAVKLEKAIHSTID